MKDGVVVEAGKPFEVIRQSGTHTLHTLWQHRKPSDDTGIPKTAQVSHLQLIKEVV